jgi:hypothetical protein
VKQKPQAFTDKGFVFVSINYRLQVWTDPDIPASTYAAEGKNHTTLNDDMGTPDDKPTKALFEFLDGVLKR